MLTRSFALPLLAAAVIAQAIAQSTILKTTTLFDGRGRVLRNH